MKKQLLTNIITIAIISVLIAGGVNFAMNKWFPQKNVGLEHFDNRIEKQDKNLDSLKQITRKIEINQDSIKNNQEIVLKNQIILQGNLDSIRTGQAIIYKEITGRTIKSYFINLIKNW